MNTWYHIKRWFERTKKEVVVIKKTKTNSRKQRDNTKLTKNQIIRIRLIWSGKGDPFPNVKNLDRLTKYCNDKLNINKSRSVYHRIVNNLGAYSSTGFLIDDTKDFKLSEKLLDTKEVSEILGVTVKSLANSRYTGIGIQLPYEKIGRLVRYKESDLKKYIEDNTFNHTGEAKVD